MAIALQDTYLLTIKLFFMKKVSVRRLSVLGVVLMAASAVTAAILPSKADGKFVNNGTLRTGVATDDDSPVALKTCVTNADGGAAVCTKTAGSTAASTDGISGGQSTVDGLQTINNTSDGVNQSRFN